MEAPGHLSLLASGITRAVCVSVIWALPSKQKWLPPHLTSHSCLTIFLHLFLSTCTYIVTCIPVCLHSSYVYSHIFIHMFPSVHTHCMTSTERWREWRLWHIYMYIYIYIYFFFFCGTYFEGSGGCGKISGTFCRRMWPACGGGLVAKSCLTLATPWTVACQAPLFMGFSRQEYWSGLPFPSPGDLPDLGIESGFPALQADSLPTELWEKPVACLGS